MRRARHSREDEVVFLTTSRANTGRHTGRLINGRVTTI